MFYKYFKFILCVIYIYLLLHNLRTKVLTPKVYKNFQRECSLMQVCHGGCWKMNFPIPKNEYQLSNESQKAYYDYDFSFWTQIKFDYKHPIFEVSNLEKEKLISWNLTTS